jgi:hypothetical protein
MKTAHVHAHKGSEIRVIRAIKNHRATRNRKIARRGRHSSFFNFFSDETGQNQIAQVAQNLTRMAGGGGVGGSCFVLIVLSMLITIILISYHRKRKMVTTTELIDEREIY